MRRVALGSIGPEIGVVGLGCMGMSWAYDAAGRDDERSAGVIHQALELGVTLFDTSDQYGPFVNESLVGAALEGRRADVVLATKGGLVVRPDGSTTRDGTPEHLRRAHTASLERLRADHVDLYQLHRVDPAVALERSWEVLAGFAEAGTALQLGLSEVSVDEIERAQAIHPVASVQTELSLWTRDALDEVVPYCRENGITFIAYSPLGRGFLSGRYGRTADLPDGDWRRRSPRFGPDAIETNRALLSPVQDAAAQLGVTPAQVALAWVLAQGEHVVAIPGTKNPHYLQENLAAARLHLPADVLVTLDALPEPVGARY